MPARRDCEEDLLLWQLFKLEQLEKLLLEAGVIEPRKQNWLLDELKQPEFLFHLQLKAQNQLRHDATLKEPSQTFSTEFGEPELKTITNNVTPNVSDKGRFLHLD